MSVRMVNGNISDVSVAIWPVGSDSCPDNGATLGGSLKDGLRFSHTVFFSEGENIPNVKTVNNCVLFLGGDGDQISPVTSATLKAAVGTKSGRIDSKSKADAKGNFFFKEVERHYSLANANVS